MRVAKAALATGDCPVCGRDSCDEHGPIAKRRLAFVSAADVMRAPSPQAVVEGVAWAGCVTVLVSESGTGKTFMLLDVASCVGDGQPWHGRRTIPGSVAYLSFEGDALGTRLRALRDVHGYRLDHLYVLRASDPLSPRIDRHGEEPSVGEQMIAAAFRDLRAELARQGKPPLVLNIIDTVRASMSGSEDRSDDVSAYLRAVRRVLGVVPDAGVILSHHSGWQDGDTQRKRERGSSAWRGNSDAVIYLEAGEHDGARAETPLTVRTLKSRDAECAAPLELLRRRVELAGELDAHGRLVTSCVIEREHRTAQERAAEVRAAAAARDRVFDLRVLRSIQQKPDCATSQDRLRLLLGGRKAAISDSLTRLIELGWVVPGPRKQPYQVTAAGQFAITDERFPTVPNDSLEPIPVNGSRFRLLGEPEPPSADPRPGGDDART